MLRQDLIPKPPRLKLTPARQLVSILYNYWYSWNLTLFIGEAAARINAMLAEKGIPLHDEVHGLSDIALKNEGEFVKDIPINDLKNRYMLTRGATQTQIQQETGAGKILSRKVY